MFQFGLFSTFIPYLFIAFAYLGFLGSDAIHNNRYLEYEGLPAQYQISKAEDFDQFLHQTVEESKIQKVSIYFDKYLKLDRFLPESYPLSKRYKLFYNFHPTSEFIGSCVFTRPPPIA